MQLAAAEGNFDLMAGLTGGLHDLFMIDRILEKNIA
jgi:hypothetical protein